MVDIQQEVGQRRPHRPAIAVPGGLGEALVRAAGRARFGVLSVAALAALALAPRPAGATITVGSDLAEPVSAQGGDCSPLAPPYTSMLARVKPGSPYPAASPADGTVVAFGIESGAAGTVAFRLLRLDAAIAAKVLLVSGDGNGPVVSLPGPGTFEFPASLPIRAGDSLGFDSSSSAAYGACQSGAESWRFSPPIADAGSPQLVLSSEDCELLVDAVVEPSAQVGFGRGAVTRSGRAVLALRLPGPGRLTLSGSEVRTAAHRVTAAGGFRVFLRLRAAAARRLARSGHVRLRVAETFAPTGGVAATESRTVSFGP